MTWTSCPGSPRRTGAFSNALLHLALRYGHPTRTGIVLDAIPAADLGRADEIMLSHYRTENAQTKLRASGSGALTQHLLPGWTKQGEALDRKIAQSMEDAARQANEDLADKLATPTLPDLIEHWKARGHNPGRALTHARVPRARSVSRLLDLPATRCRCSS